MTSVQLNTFPAPTASTPAPRVLSDSPQRWRFLALLFLALFIGYANRGALSVAAPFMSEDLGLSKLGLGLAMSAFYWSYTLMQVPAGWAVDRFGPARPYAIGFIGWSLASAMTGMASGLRALIGLRVAGGVGQSISFPATTRAVADAFHPHERGTASGIYLNGSRLGAAAITWGGVYFLANHGWKQFFVVTGLIPLLWLLPWMKFINFGNSKSASTVRSGPYPSDSQSWKNLLRHRTILGLFLGGFAYGYGWYVFVSWLPSYLVMERHFAPKEMAILGSMPFLMMAVTSLFSGMFGDWLVRRGFRETRTQKALAVVGLAVGCLIAPAGFVTDRTTAVLLLTISLGGLGITSPQMWTLPISTSEHRMVGTVTGIQNVGCNLGGIIAPALTGLLVQSTGSFSLALAMTGVILLTGIPSFWFLVSDSVSAVRRSD